jgi:hypothetical protein
LLLQVPERTIAKYFSLKMKMMPDGVLYEFDIDMLDSENKKKRCLMRVYVYFIWIGYSNIKDIV